MNRARRRQPRRPWMGRACSVPEPVAQARMEALSNSGETSASMATAIVPTSVVQTGA